MEEHTASSWCQQDFNKRNLEQAKRMNVLKLNKVSSFLIFLLLCILSCYAPASPSPNVGSLILAEDKTGFEACKKIFSLTIFIPIHIPYLQSTILRRDVDKMNILSTHRPWFHFLNTWGQARLCNMWHFLNRTPSWLLNADLDQSQNQMGQDTSLEKCSCKPAPTFLNRQTNNLNQSHLRGRGSYNCCSILKVIRLFLRLLITASAVYFPSVFPKQKSAGLIFFKHPAVCVFSRRPLVLTPR